MLLGLLCLVPLLLSAGRATYCCALAVPCCLVLAVLCTAVHVLFFFVLGHAACAECWLCVVLVCACWPMLLTMLAVLCAAVCLFAHAA